MLILTCLSVLGYSGCSKAPPLPHDEIITMVKESIRAPWKNTPVRYDVIEIIEIGKYDKDKGYFPVKIHAKYNYQFVSPYTGEKDRRTHIDDVRLVRFGKDEFGKWTIVDQENIEHKKTLGDRG